MATYAPAGYTGFVKFGTAIVRATSCDIKTSQAITFPEVVDGRADTTIYQMSPLVTGGGCSFPLIHDTANGTCNSPTSATLQADSVVANLWDLVAARDSSGRLQSFNTTVRYANNLAYLYPNCYLDSLTFTVAQSAEVQMQANVIGGATASNGVSDRTGDPSLIDNSLNYLAPARVATWNDAIIALINLSGSNVLGNELREFTCTINNQVERFYTLNGTLSAFDIIPKKRIIEGTLKIVGNSQVLSQTTNNNANYFTTNSQIAFGMKLGGPAQPAYWATGLNGVIFEIEEVAISTGLFETNTKWRSMAECETFAQNYDATFLGTNGLVAASASTTPIAYGDGTLAVPVYGYNGI